MATTQKIALTDEWISVSVGIKAFYQKPLGGYPVYLHFATEPPPAGSQDYHELTELGITYLGDENCYARVRRGTGHVIVTANVLGEADAGIFDLSFGEELA